MDTPAENTVVVCDTISRITKMLPVLLNCHFGSFVPCSEQNVHPLPVSDAGPFAHFCAKGCAGRYAQNSAHLRSALKIQL